MHAIEVTATGGPDVLKYVDKPRPLPGPGEVLIKAEAIGVNFVDTYFRSGSYPHRLPFVLGAEVGGTVEAVGDGVTALRVGSLVLFGAASGPVPPVDPQRLNAAGSVYLTRPSRLHFIRTRDEFTWRTNQLFDAIATGTVIVNVSARYPLKDAAQAHRDLEGRRTVGSVVLTP
jgi:NADPH:quinone reductase-like Zn-dependent oxidoreductase